MIIIHNQPKISISLKIIFINYQLRVFCEVANLEEIKDYPPLFYLFPPRPLHFELEI